MGTAPTELHLVPHFEVRTLDGRHVRYRDLWQRRNLVLVLASPHEPDAATRYGLMLQAHHDDFEEAQATVVVTTDSVQGLPAPAAIVADRWGEILHVETPTALGPTQFPDVDELLAWVQFARIQCPECPP